MHTKLLVALFAALALTACQKAEEAAAPETEQPQESSTAAAHPAGDSMQAAGRATGDAAQKTDPAASDSAAAGAAKIESMAGQAKEKKKK
ncbi:MAG: hypothetical protein IV085_09000 [Thiobacillus sp.]|nr:hypothetical protein [Thiobacillus sp.]